MSSIVTEDRSENVDALDALVDDYISGFLEDRELIYDDILPETYVGTGETARGFRPEYVRLVVGYLNQKSNSWTHEESTKSTFSPQEVNWGDSNGVTSLISSILKLMDEVEILERDDWGRYDVEFDESELLSFYQASVLDFAYRWEEHLYEGSKPRYEMLEDLVEKAASEGDEKAVVGNGRGNLRVWPGVESTTLEQMSLEEPDYFTDF